jgi:hypothetical protein
MLCFLRLSKKRNKYHTYINYICACSTTNKLYSLVDVSNLSQHCSGFCMIGATREAGGKVLVLEAVVGSTSANVSVEPQLLSDMSMLASIGGAERDENEQDLVLTKLSIPLDSRQSSRYISLIRYIYMHCCSSVKFPIWIAFACPSLFCQFMYVCSLRGTMK